MATTRMCKFDLINELKKLNLDISGRIDELRTRLQAALDAAPAVPPLRPRTSRVCQAAATVTTSQINSSAAPVTQAFVVSRRTTVTLAVESSVQMVATPTRALAAPLRAVARSMHAVARPPQAMARALQEVATLAPAI